MLNGRQVPSADELEYDAAGNLVANEPNVDNWQKFTYDSAGRQTVHEEKWKRGGPISGQPVTRYHGEANMLYDGDGRLVRQHWDKDYTLTIGSHSIPSNYRRIYSTVIGQELSSIEENLNGEMKTTKVFAGGSSIGEQESWTPTGSGTSEIYRGISRDPISGSRVRSGILEHYEPLGQVIDPNPPLEDPPPPGMTDGYNDSRFAGIQCQSGIAKGLDGTDLPWACRRSAEEDIRHKVIALWPSWNEKDGNTAKMVDSPIMRDWAGGSSLPHSFAAKAMVGSMFSTKKDDPQDGGDLGSVTIKDPGPTTPLDELAGTGAENSSTMSALTEDESLAKCIYDLLINRFADVNVNGAKFNAVKSVWFSPGTSAAVEAYDWAKGNWTTHAITVGTTVHYNTASFPNLSKPTWSQFEIMVEEVAHVNQFLNMWASMPAQRLAPDPTHSGPGTRPPNYTDAVIKWGLNYAAAVLATPKGKDSYEDNSIEAPAKAEARSIVQSIRSNISDRDGPCGK